MGDLEATIRRNIKKRNEELGSHDIDQQLMWQLIRNFRRRRRQAEGEDGGNGNVLASSSDSDSSDEEMQGPDIAGIRGVECVIA